MTLKIRWSHDPEKLRVEPLAGWSHDPENRVVPSGSKNQPLGGPIRLKTGTRDLAAPGKDALIGFDWSPSVDITETPEEFQIKAELPEVKKEDVKIRVENGMLSISGERKQDKEEQNKKWHRVERSYGSFLRTFTLPENVDESQVRAEFKDGLLTMRLPKSASAKPKATEIKIS